jgi:TfoX/Sxy family transcriptional regulator of competence genes
MAYSEELADRTRDELSRRTEFNERKMFGGLTFMVNGHMCCGIVGDELMVRVGPGAYEAALEEPHAREMDFTGRSLRGMVYVSPHGVGTNEQLALWVERGLEFVRSLPPK